MGCLYCGKEIGPFRLLRDDEFCSSAHRKRYGERLGKALDRIGAPELTPSGVPGVRKIWPVQEGHRRKTEGIWDFGHPEHPVQTGELWPFNITPTLGDRSKPLTLEPARNEHAATWSNIPPQPLSMAISLPPFGQNWQIGLPMMSAALAGRPPAGLAPRENRPKAKVTPLEARVPGKSKPAEVICLPVFESTLHSGLPAVNRALPGAVQEGIAPAESQLRCRVVPLPVGPRISTAPKSVERPQHSPRLEPFEELMPVPEPEAAERPVLPSLASDVEVAIGLRMPEMPGVAMAQSPTAPGAQCAATTAQPAARLVEARVYEAALAPGIPLILPSPACLQHIPDQAMDSNADANEDCGCPAMPGLKPVPVESLLRYSVSLELIAPACTLRLPSLDALAVPRTLGDGLGLSEDCKWPNPAEAFLPPASVPEPVLGAAEMLSLPGLSLPAGTPRSPGLSGSRPTLMGPVESPVPLEPSTAAIAPITDSPSLQLPAAGFSPEQPAFVDNRPRQADPQQAGVIAAKSGLEAVLPETRAFRLPDVPLTARLSGLPGMPENGPIWTTAIQESAPTATAPELDAVLPEIPALRLPVAFHGKLAAPTFGMSENSPVLPQPVQSLLPEAAAPQPLPMMPEVPALRLPSMALAIDAPLGMRVSASRLRLPQPAELVPSFAAASAPLASPAGGFVPQLPAPGHAFEMPSPLTRLRPPAAARDKAVPGSTSPALNVVAMASRPVSGYAPAPLPMEAPSLVLALPVPAVSGSTAGQVGPAAGPSATPVESLPAIAAFAPFRISGSPELRFPQVPERKSSGLSVAGLGQAYPLYAPPEPRTLNPDAALLTPISRLRINQLAVPGDRQDPAIPKPGFIPIEFYCQRGLVAPCQRLSWTPSRIEPLWMPFAMRAVADRSDELATWKPAAKEPAKEIPAIDEAARARYRNRMFERFVKVAACLLMGVFLWFGAHELQTAKTRAISQRASAAANISNGDGSFQTVTPASGSQPKGIWANVQHAIANRAAVTIGDTMQAGMQSWGAPAKSWAPGWVRNADGYVHPGDLALFSPTLGYKDYRLEFFGQIENKSMDWVVRAKDKQNYYAMKFTVVEAGLRPIIAMAHYPVVQGRKGHKVETPLSVMMHRNSPVHVAIDVQGNRLTAMVEGQQVDSWTDDLLPTGGVGFFSETGERARLYWMKVSKNQDWLGTICSYLSGDEGTRDTAEVWGQGIPGERPAPPAPSQSPDVLLAEAETRTSNLKGPIQRARSSIERRIRPWNS